MLDKLLPSFLLTGTGRRVVVLLVTALVVALNKRAGLGLDPAEVSELVYLAMAYIIAGNVKGAAEALTAFVSSRVQPPR